MARKKNNPSTSLRNRSTQQQTKPKQNKVEKEVVDNSFTFQKFLCYMFEPDDASYLAVFRVMWGIIMMMEMGGHISNNFAKTMSSFYNNPKFTFKFWGLEWCEVPKDPMHLKIFVVVMFILATFITIGLLYRISSILFAIGFLYFFGLEAALYLNHFYLVAVISFMLCFLPCHVYFSVDAMLFPSVASNTVPKWCLWTIRTELWIVYTYAGVAKMNLDWLRAEPLRHWLIKRRHYPFIGWLLQYEPVVYWFSWSGLIYDTVVGTLLIVPQTFYIGLASTLFFHLCNKYIFNIGIFPWLMIASTCLYFEPHWPRRLIHTFKESSKRHPQKFTDYPKVSWGTTKTRKLKLKEKLILLVCALFLAQQVISPIRHYMYPGNVFWNEYGHRYSWRMKLRDKQCDGEVWTYSRETQNWFEFPLENILTPRQYGKFNSRPEFIAQTVEQAANEMAKQNSTVELYVYAACRVNYRPASMMTDPRINVVEEDKWEWPYKWVTDMPELTEEQRQELPWNFEWNFNWLLQPWESNIPKLKKEQEDNIKIMNDLTASWEYDFRDWIIAEKFDGNAKKADAYRLNFVDQKRKQKNRQQALQGLLIFRN